jgi:hypothetical protein
MGFPCDRLWADWFALGSAHYERFGWSRPCHRDTPRLIAHCPGRRAMCVAPLCRCKPNARLYCHKVSTSVPCKCAPAQKFVTTDEIPPRQSLRHPHCQLPGCPVEVLRPDVRQGGQADSGDNGPLLDALAVNAEHRDSGRVKSDTPGLMGLGVFDADELVGVGDGTGDSERGEVEIDVNPTQTAKLAPPSTGGCGYINEAAEVLVVVGARLEQGLELLPGRRVDLGSTYCWRGGAQNLIGIDPSPSDGLVESR